MSEKSKIAQKEEEILKFWKENQIFEKSLKKDSPKGEFVFYDGPPFATGLPHYGTLLSSVIKDVIPRYKTMQGFKVRRRWGWDCHGLPIESLVEKKLELKTKKDIENIGVGKFNKGAREMVLEYANDWEKYIERIGRWVEFKNSYKTMDNSYIESIWWALSEINKKGLLYEGKKVLMYCPRCETPLAKAEIAMDNSYKDITEDAVVIKFEIRNSKSETNSKFLNPKSKTYLLAWTTTPWTLPGNVALAVGEKIDYVKIKINDEIFILAKERLLVLGEEYEIIEEIKGKDLVGLEYEPLFDIPEIKESEQSYKVYEADFVTTEEGTGIVHTAVMYGEDDFALGQKEGLPMIQLLDASGKFNEKAPEFLRGKYIKKAEKEIVEDLEKRNLLFEKSPNTHSYPHCYRCGTPLIYNTLTSWFINIQKVKKEIIKNNEKVDWFPEHLKHGRFLNIVENAPDWTISRNRYWASPLPIWKNEKGDIKVLGSIDELKKYTKKSGNKYFVMRHGEAEQNLADLINSDPKNVFHLTEKGKQDVKIVAGDIKSKKIDLIIASPFDRCKETAEIVRQTLGLPENSVLVEDRIFEERVGEEYEGKTWEKFRSNFKDQKERYDKRLPGAENFTDIKKRVGELLYSLEKEHENKNILLVSHQLPINALYSASMGTDLGEVIALKKEGKFLFQGAEFGELNFTSIPHNENYELDLHKPYIDEIELVDEDGNKLKRIPEVVDCWVESGSMPFAEWHYPFENKKEFESRFPGDFIAEYIAQTRTWFYYTHVLGTILFGSNAFKNVITTGTILAADGAKISKSKNNYTDPLLNIDKYSADALRFYLMGSVVMRAEDLNFNDEELREAQNKVINLLWNSLKFYELYKSDVKNVQSKNILDRWIKSRLYETMERVTKAMENYDLVKASRLIPKFVDDLSTWYIRRSRDRFKNDENVEDKKATIATTREVLSEFSKIIAPITPFLAEIIYQSVKSKEDPESVHLCEWPKVGKVDEEILKNMEEVRKIVSLVMEKRNTAGIKVRQPLQKIQISKSKYQNLGEEYLDLIKDEVNVKEIEFSEKLEIELDTEINDQLQKEGNVRELVRSIQALRKNKGLIPSDSVKLIVETDEIGKEFIKSFEQEIKKPTNVGEIIFDINDGEELKIENYKLKIKIK